MRAVGTEFVAAFGEPHAVRDDVWMIPLPVLHAQPKHSLAYVVRDADGGLHVIDPGEDRPENRTLLEAALDRLGGVRRVQEIFATHAHADHLGAAAWLARRADAPVIISRAEARSMAPAASHEPDRQAGRNIDWGVPADRRDELLVAAQQAHGRPVAAPDLLVDDGELLAVSGRRIRVLATPGHTAGHACLVDEDQDLVFTGDLVLPRINPGFGLGGDSDDPLGDFLASLERISEYDAEACPGHEQPFHGLGARCREISAHHLRRSTRIAELLGEAEAPVWEVATRLEWRTPLERMRGGYLRSALLQVSMHVDHLSAVPAPVTEGSE